MVRFFRTKNRRVLWAGLSLCLLPPAFLVLVTIVLIRQREQFIPSTSCYIPVIFSVPMAGRNSPQFEAEKKALEGKCRERVSPEVIRKISKPDR